MLSIRSRKIFVRFCIIIWISLARRKMAGYTISNSKLLYIFRCIRKYVRNKSS